MARRTIYAGTDRRAIIVETPCWYTTHSFGDEQLSDFLRREDRRGHGDIIFERKVTRGPKSSIDIREKGFFDLPDASTVEELLRSAYFSPSRA